MTTIRQRLLATTVSAFAALSTCACGMFDQQERIEDWETANHYAFAAFRDQHYNEALGRYQKALDKAVALGQNDAHVALTKNDIARTYVAMGNWQFAKDWYGQAAAVLVNNSGNLQNIETLCESYEGIANSDVQLNQLNEADSNFKKAFELAQRYNLPRLRDIVYEYKGFLIAQGRDKDAAVLEAQQKAISQQAAISNPQASDEERYRTAMRDGEEAYRKQNLNEAEKQYTEAMQIAKENEDEMWRAQTCLHMADVQRDKGELNKAERLLRFAAETFQGSDNRDFLIAMTKISEVLRLEKKYTEAAEAAQVVVQDSLQFHSEDEHEIAAALSQLIRVQQSAGLWHEAAESNRKVFDICSKHKGPLDAGTVLAMCYTTDCLELAKSPADARKFVDAYTAKLSKCKPTELQTPIKMFNDFADASVQKKRKATAKCLYEAALALSKKVPKETVETARAQKGLEQT